MLSLWQQEAKQQRRQNYLAIAVHSQKVTYTERHYA
jgi:hypothetical protein